MKIRKYSFHILLAVIAVAFSVWQSSAPITTLSHGKIMKVAVLDIGQGDSIYIEAPDGHQMIIDGGPGSFIMGELEKVMPVGDKTIDTLIITNPDKDHIAGFLDVMKNFDVYAVLESGTKKDTKIYKEIEDAIVREGAKRAIVRRGMKVELDSTNGVYFDILFPDSDVSAWDVNDGSIVGRLVYGKTSMMFTGDSTKKTEKIILSENSLLELKSDILKVGHHGSRTSTSQDFFSAVSPTYAVLSSGINNTYGP